ncbi:acetyl-CoA carboxylase biotin carboxyl carrier protein subunit [Nocardioides gilvus]|uniref:acetyl-CoA carboxylase biotin carboxyl carrier protein subunit n=1 Tax=Nocardioides gilvus TaxID=1735589 RepID=UPI000D74E284|nr:acetyl-CoA carboxylase biotin carboxyl carrier protein subunit [Nocardioides gilvus]
MLPHPADLPSQTSVRAPFHGLVTILVRPGDTVGAGEVVALLEAMKMEAPITAPRAGRVAEISFEDPRTVAGGDLLVVLARDGSPPENWTD